MPTIKRDQYRQKRGGKSKLLKLSCSGCGSHLFTYQKDGDGGLLRCYLNRIIEPAELEKLQFQHAQKSTLEALKCPQCQKLIGIPMQYTDGRLAYRLVPGSFAKEVAINVH